MKNALGGFVNETLINLDLRYLGNLDHKLVLELPKEEEGERACWVAVFNCFCTLDKFFRPQIKQLIITDSSASNKRFKPR